MVSKARLDLPDPDGPRDNHELVARYLNRDILRLCSRAPVTLITSALASYYTNFCRPCHIVYHRIIRYTIGYEANISSTLARTDLTSADHLTLFVGLTLVLTSGAIGWLPGPGGIPVFYWVYSCWPKLNSKWADDFGPYHLETYP